MLYWHGDRTLLRPRPTPPGDAMLLGEHVEEAEYDAVPLIDSEAVVNVPGYGSAWWDEHVATANDTELEDRVMELPSSVGGSAADAERGCAISVLGRMSFDEMSPTDLAVKYGKREGDD